MIKAEVDGSGLLLLAAGCATLGVDGVAGLSGAGPLIAPAPLLDFFFLVMLSKKIGPSMNGVIFSQKKPRFVQGPCQRQD